jgi:multimeric flavodoxin WrbA
MSNDLTRRIFLGAAGAAAAGTIGQTAAAESKAPANGPIKIVAVSGSLRKGKTTATALRVCLEAAKAVDPDHIEVELIELADYQIDDALAIAAGKPGQRDDFPKLAPKLADPNVGGIILGSPCYFGNMSGLCKSFLDRWGEFRKNFALSNKVGGALAVGSNRNGGQEQVLRSIHTSLFGQEMIIVGDGRPTCHWGGALWNNWKDDILQDEAGIATAKNLGRRVAEIARILRRGS